MDLKSIDSEIIINDTNLKTFGKSYFRDMVFADMQYCVLCDEYNKNNLYCVHIFDANKTNDIDLLSDPNNGLIMCKKHAQMYINKQFTFDERGKVIKSSDDDIKDARISNKIFVKRKAYFEMLNKQ